MPQAKIGSTGAILIPAAQPGTNDIAIDDPKVNELRPLFAAALGYNLEIWMVDPKTKGLEESINGFFKSLKLKVDPIEKVAKTEKARNVAYEKYQKNVLDQLEAERVLDAFGYGTFTGSIFRIMTLYVKNEDYVFEADDKAALKDLFDAALPALTEVCQRLEMSKEQSEAMTALSKSIRSAERGSDPTKLRAPLVKWFQQRLKELIPKPKSPAALAAGVRCLKKT